MSAKLNMGDDGRKRERERAIKRGYQLVQYGDALIFITQTLLFMCLQRQEMGYGRFILLVNVRVISTLIVKERLISALIGDWRATDSP